MFWKRRRMLLLLTVVPVGALMMAGCGRGSRAYAINDGDAAEQVEEKLDEVFDYLDATPDQQAVIRPIVNELVKDGMALKDEGRGAKKELRAQLESDDPDADKVHELIDAQMDEFKTFAHKAADRIIEIHQVLTPEQRSKIEKHVKENKRHRRGWHGH